MYHSGSAPGGPGAVLGKNFFSPVFEIFFLKVLSFSHSWSQSSEIWSHFGVTMTLEFDKKKILKIGDF